MDVSNEQEKSSKSPITHPHHVSSPSEHIIPQMIITSAEDTSDTGKNVSECTLVLIPPSNVHSTDQKDRNTSAEFTESANSVTEDRPVVDFEDISVVVRDVVSKCAESVSHSVRQRPLVIEVDKNAQQQETNKDNSLTKCPPPPPPPVPPPVSNVTSPSPVPSITPPPSSTPVVTCPPTAMQRPLVFEGVVTKNEPLSEMQKEDAPVKETTKIKEELVCDRLQGLSSEVPVEGATSSEECISPTKKDGKHGVKKFFDSLWHPENQELSAKSEEPESPKESDISPDASKSGKNIKKFFQPHKDSTKLEESPSPEPLCENKESISFAKDAKQNIKSFFDSFKQEPVESKDSIETKTVTDLPSKEVAREKITQPTTSDIPKESKDTSFAKDTKQNIKAFFDTFKHEPSEQKLKSSPDKKVPPIDISSEVQVEKNLQSPKPESPKESTSFAKDTKQNIKSFFDTFKHEPNEQKDKSGISKKTVSQPNIAEEPKRENVPESAISENIKETKAPTSFAKDTKQNVKSFFDTFKHESNEQKPKMSVTKKSISQPDVCQEETAEKSISSVSASPKESSSFVKDTKQNIKTFFDTFKHDSSDVKQKESTCKKSASHSDFTRESKEIDTPIQESSAVSKNKESVSFAKGARQNVKSFFDTFKHESKIEDSQKKIGESQKKIGESQKKIGESQKKIEDSQKKIEDSQKKIEDNQVPFMNEPSYVLDHYGDNQRPFEFTTEHEPLESSDTKQNSYFDTFKDSGSKEISSKKPTASVPDLHKESTDGRIIHHKDKHPLKKFFSFKHIGEGGENISPELSGSLDSQLPKESKKDKPLKTAKSVKLDLHPKYSSNGTESISASYSHMNGHETELISATKERAQSVPNDALIKSNFDVVPEKMKSEDTIEGLSSPVEKPDEHKDNRQGIKKFFDSFKHEKSGTEKSSSQSISAKKESAKELSAGDLALGSEESKVTEKPTKDKKGKIKRSLSDKVSREEVVQNFKGFFDSISHRSPSKKSVKDSEHIYDVVEVKSDTSSPVPTIRVFDGTDASKSSAIKSETQGTKKMFSPFRSKDTPKSGFENIDVSQSKVDKVAEESLKKGSKLQNSGLSKDLEQTTSRNVKDATTSDLSPTTSEPGSPKPEKSSVFNAIGENILSLKEKMLHSKEKRKSGIIEDSVEVSDKIPKTEEIGKEKSQSVKKKEETVLPSTSKESSKENIVKTKPAPAEKPKQIKELSKSQTPQVVNKAETGKETPSTHPSSLYDTCCMKIAVLLRDKALDIVTDRSRSPPPKPPKPSAEAIAKARAAAVSRRLADSQKMGHSVGESFPLGCEGMRFADDETESSCDYKDVENFDYIMDYDLLKRCRLDSTQLDTFSVPSTCSGLTSYYTADTFTSRDEIYSDAMIMETVSLSSDVSYNLKQLPSSSKSEPKILGLKENKSKTDVSRSKQSGVKKIPPPVPPKPVLLQNISKIKGKADDKAVSQCVNGLSLSPRLQNKFSKDPAVTQKRPLMVADIKGTQFSSLQHPKKSAPQKPVRHFDTLLKNESLKNIPCVSSDNVLTAAEKVSKTDSTLQSSVKVGKRTVSPPRPPPPNISKKPEKPPKPERPPPPVKSSKADGMTEEKCEKLENDGISDLGDVKNLSEEQTIEIAVQSAIEENCKDSELSELSSSTVTVQEISYPESAVDTTKSHLVEIINDSYESDLKIQQDSLNNNVEVSKDIADSLNNNIEVTENIPLENPKPPPRNRRIRSRTVEVVPTEKQEERIRRSQSLSEIDVQKRVTFLTAEKAEVDAKSLYTTVNKNGKRSSNERTSQSSPDLVSCRPLPAPPPPPRRFRSLERKGKSKKVADEQNFNTEQMSTSPVPSEDSIKAPTRRRKTEKQRFFSLHTDHRKEIDEASENLKRTASVPSKPDRKMKSSTKYDINANVSSLQTSQEDLNLSSKSIPNIDTTDSSRLSKLKSKKDIDSRERSHSSWYDDETHEESWEVIDVLSSPDLPEEYKQSPKVPLRRKLETKRKSRETSKFYVNMEEETSASPSLYEESSPVPSIYKSVSPFPLVDKETSPLRLDCSEKSVQTSLETLSQGIVSRDEQSDDTDELLDLAQTLQKELSTIINRHKSVNESTEDTPSPPLSAATSEKNLTEDFKDIKKSSSVRSSTSEVWPITSSDESDVERVGEESSNINEIAIKRKQKKIFYIAQEIMTSEEAFVDALKLLNVDFKAAVEAANKQKNMNIIPDEVLAQILNHLPQLQHLNENLLMELKDRIENWDKTEKIADIIVKMGPFLKLYSWYIHDFESSVSLLEESKRKYPAFSQVVKEFEMSSRCKRLALNHYMLKPIQRIPQYRLLLQEYLHHLTEDSKDYQDTVAALQIVSEVANHANDSMKHGDNAQKLISIQNSIMGHKEIVKPGRIFVKEGELMKLSRKGMQPRWFVLFNDLLLYLTPVQQGLYRVNHELPLTGMKVAIPIQQDYQNEFSIISVTRSFTLAARSQEERQEWIIALTKAIEENASKRSTFTNSRLNQKAQDKTSSEDEAAFVLGKKAPVWIPDARVTMCQLCTSEFTVTFRRHHCRACGKVVCSICSSHRISLPYLGNRIARVCDECHMRLGQGSSACTESGETDSENQQIAVKSHLRTDNRHLKKNKRVLPSVLKEVCANDQGSTISGYLHRRTAKSWKRDWFVVKDKVLYEYKASEDVAALRSIPLLGYQIELFSEACEGVDSSLLFQLTHPGQAPIVFYADTVGSAERWVSALKTATVLE